MGSPRALARAARGQEPWGSARSWRPEQRGAVFGWTRGRAGGQSGERAAVLLESLREGTEKATASPAAAASCSGVREETALKAHGQRLPPAGRAGCQPVTFSAFIFSCYFLVCKGENEAPVAQSLTWKLFPAGVSSLQVADSACTGCVRLFAAAQRLFERVSCRSFLRAPQERRRGRFLTSCARATHGVPTRGSSR